MVANELGLYPEGAPEIQEIINAIPGSSIWIMKLSMMILPLICILIGFFLYQKKFKIDEVLYAQIVKDLEERNSEKVEK
jgi:Na+/melibiose symporter-like transporter